MTVGQPVTVVRAMAAADGLLHAQHEQLANSVVTAAQLAAGLRRAVGWLGPGTPVPARSMLPHAELHRVDVVFGDPPATAAAAAELALAFGVAGPRMPVGLVGRIGRAHAGLALALAGDVLARVCVLRHSLVVAPAGSRPGAGVTTALRDMARTLAEPPWALDVVVLDRSLELGGGRGGGGAGSSAPHAGLGRARRWCPPAGSTLTDVLAECRPPPAAVVVDDVVRRERSEQCMCERALKHALTQTVCGRTLIGRENAAGIRGRAVRVPALGGRGDRRGCRGSRPSAVGRKSPRRPHRGHRSRRLELLDDHGRRLCPGRPAPSPSHAPRRRRGRETGASVNSVTNRGRRHAHIHAWRPIVGLSC